MRRCPIFLTYLAALVIAARSQQQGGNPSPSNFPPVLQVSSSEGYLPETAEIGTTVRVSANLQSESLQILVTDEDLVSASISHYLRLFANALYYS
jgi:hypothetical protein